MRRRRAGVTETPVDPLDALRALDVVDLSDVADLGDLRATKDVVDAHDLVEVADRHRETLPFGQRGAHSIELSNVVGSLWATLIAAEHRRREEAAIPF